MAKAGTQRKLVNRVAAAADAAASKPGPGRPVGSLNRITNSTRERVIRDYSVLPIDYFMSILNTPIGGRDKFGDKVGKADRFEAAKQAAPYLHQRLVAAEVTGKDGGAVKYSIDIEKLSTDELVALEQLVLKSAQVFNPLELDENDVDYHRSN